MHLRKSKKILNDLYDHTFQRDENNIISNQLDEIQDELGKLSRKLSAIDIGE